MYSNFWNISQDSRQFYCSENSPGWELYLILRFVFYERLLASRAYDVFGIYGVVKVNLTAAVRAERTVEICVVVIVVTIVAVVTITSAVAVVITAAASAIVIVVTAIAVVFVDVVYYFFNSAEIFVDFFDIVVACVNLSGELGKLACKLSAELCKRRDNLSLGSGEIKICAFKKTLDVCAEFRRFHNTILSMISKARRGALP